MNLVTQRTVLFKWVTLTHIGWLIQKRESNATGGQNESQKISNISDFKIIFLP